MAINMPPGRTSSSGDIQETMMMSAGRTGSIPVPVNPNRPVWGHKPSPTPLSGSWDSRRNTFISKSTFVSLHVYDIR